ncbi:Zinc finger, C2H2 type family protein [Trichomonas vaginalis G3]|uniref:Zinc finger, C2H2 type family protein n=1 Tax=Trichomonas vaginalis (strain ATCC PRA-98 / G3) TaxID=412133 RepID=A2ESF1_TRIV3|nr:mitotic spindle assembly [Trichomonas vaginalis G3]EAY04395.1 Zinc finger, C2H2 type family protein [Trichomonas vaginalis G3]KAI5526348.1 mitotic spindle assembly [Trichomonas vaginalis G3]|eukprot:XP_001316618.1 Zinc finger, C2H2 type family protein [Trichomonas vaginalis G3]
MSKKVYCYFCNSSFDDENQLISHQKSKHFRCPICSQVKQNLKSLNNHMLTLHRTYLEAVPGAIEGRKDPNVNIFGLSGIPEDVYVTWLASIDPTFKANIKDMNVDGAYIANQAVKLAALNTAETSKSIFRNQLLQFTNARLQTAPVVEHVLTAKGVISSEQLHSQSKNTSFKASLENAQKRFETSKRRAAQILWDAERAAEKSRKKLTKERRAKEELYFQPPSDGLTVFELRAQFLANNQKE